MLPGVDVEVPDRRHMGDAAKRVRRNLDLPGVSRGREFLSGRLRQQQHAACNCAEYNARLSWSRHCTGLRLSLTTAWSRTANGIEIIEFPHLLIADILVRELGGSDRQVVDPKPDTDENVGNQ